MRDSRFRATNNVVVSGPMILTRTRLSVVPINGHSIDKIAAAVATAMSQRRVSRAAETAAGKSCVTSADMSFVPRTKVGENLESKILEQFCCYIQEEEHGWKKKDTAPNVTLIHGKQEPAVKRDLHNVVSSGLLDIAVATETLTAGVDIKNIAFVFAWTLASLAKTFQSAGRAGRGDGLHDPAACAGCNPTKFQALIYEAHRTVRVSHERVDLLAPPGAGVDASEVLSEAAQHKTESLLHAHAEGRRSDVMRYHKCLTDCVTCRVVLIHREFAPDGVDPPLPCYEVEGRPMCDNCACRQGAAKRHALEVDVTRALMMSALIGHDAVVEDPIRLCTYENACKSIKLNMCAAMDADVKLLVSSMIPKGTSASGATAEQQQGGMRGRGRGTRPRGCSRGVSASSKKDMVARAKRALAATSYPPASAAWLVDTLIGLGVFVPRLEATFTNAHKRRRDSTVSGSADQPGEAPAKTHHGGKLAEIVVPGGPDRVLLKDNCNLVYDLSLNALCPNPDKVTRPFTVARRGRQINLLYADTKFPFELFRPVFPAVAKKQMTIGVSQRQGTTRGVSIPP